MSSSDSSREPCPDRILDDVGGAFAFGAVGGSIIQYVKGAYISPNGSRMFGGTERVRMKVPATAGSFAVWGGLFSTLDCTMVYVRQKEDPWNSILAGAATGGLLSWRQGLRAASKSAVMGGVLLALIEGVGIVINKMNPPDLFAMEVLPTEYPGQAPTEYPGQAPVTVESLPSPSSWFGGLLGGKKEEHVKSGGGSVTEVLESFDAPPVPLTVDTLSSPSPSSSTSSSWFGGLFGGKKEEHVKGGGGSVTEVLENFDAPPVPSFQYE